MIIMLLCNVLEERDIVALRAPTRNVQEEEEEEKQQQQQQQAELGLQQAPEVAMPRAAPPPEESPEAGTVEPGQGELATTVVR